MILSSARYGILKLVSPKNKGYGLNQFSIIEFVVGAKGRGTQLQRSPSSDLSPASYNFQRFL